MGRIEQDLQNETHVELTPEMRRYLVRDLIGTREYIEGVLANAIDGILVTSPAGLIMGSNQSFKRLVGYSERELTNQPVTIVSPGTAPTRSPSAARFPLRSSILSIWRT